MAQKIILVDDIDGTEGAETVQFELLGGTFQLDLKPEYAEQLDNLIKAFHPFNEALQKLAADNGTVLGVTRDLNVPPGASEPAAGEDGRPGPAAAGSAPKPAATRPGLPAPAEEIRAWARANGWEVSAKGKVPKAVVEAFIAADNGQKGNQPGEIEAPTPMTGEANVGHQGPIDLTPVQPADDAPVEDWRAYAVALGHTSDDVYHANRSQIRTLLGLEQPIPTGPEWGDLPPAASQTVSSFPVAPPTDPFPSVVPVAPAPAPAPNPEAGTTDEPTLGQRLHREANARKEAARVAVEAAASVARAQAESQAAREVVLDEVHRSGEVPLTPEQVEEQARAEIAQAQGLPAPEPTTILPFRQPS